MRLQLRQCRPRFALIPLIATLFVLFVFALYFNELNNDKGHDQFQNELRGFRQPERSGSYSSVAKDVWVGKPADPTVAAMRDEVRQMAKEAWDAYVQYAWGSNELRPVSRKGYQPEGLGKIEMGATIVDGMDTLFIMGLHKEFSKARDFVKNSLNFNQSSVVSVSQYTIRFLGGLLSTYTLTMEEIFLIQAIKLADRLLPAFNTPTGIPFGLIDLRNGPQKPFVNNSYCSSLAELGTLHMEFTFLSELTGDGKYANAVNRVRRFLANIHRPNGLFYDHVNHDVGIWCCAQASLSTMSHSFYEYLLKEWIRTNHVDTQSRSFYDQALQALFQIGIFKRSASGLLYLASYQEGSVNSVMDQPSCSAGGMFALGASGPEDAWFEIGQQVTYTCRTSYLNTAAHLGPESFEFYRDRAEIAPPQLPSHPDQTHYVQRPDLIASYFYLWRLTHNETYRAWAWDVVQALKAHTRTGTGYSGLENVHVASMNWTDVQRSSFLAGVLKFMYLIFSEDSLFPLDHWVFNSAGHPFPIHERVRLAAVPDWPKSYA